eukprot:8142463-Ditylum_brightwellii.AAC.1
MAKAMITVIPTLSTVLEEGKNRVRFFHTKLDYEETMTMLMVGVVKIELASEMELMLKGRDEMITFPKHQARGCARQASIQAIRCSI